MKYNQKRNIFVAIIIFLAGIFLGGRFLITKNQNPLPANHYQVSSVLDGDTLKIKDGQRVRLIGIDAPESGNCYYDASTRALKDLVENKTVRMEKDITDKDMYGRLLRYVILPNENGDDLLVNDYLTRQGFAKTSAVSPDTRYRDLLASAQQEAFKSKLGMWDKCGDELENQTKRELDSQPADPACVIKGNISEKGYGKTYLMPGCASYDSTKVDPRKGEQYFGTEEEATAAGFRRATNCPEPVIILP